MSVPFRFSLVRIFLTIAVVTGLVGCKRSSAPTPPAGAASPPTFRIVCLSPALTDIIIDLGFESNIVGRDIWDEQLSDAIPRIGDLYQLDYEALIALKPTDVVLQVLPQNVPPFLLDVARSEGFNIVTLHIDSLADVRDAMHDLTQQLSFTGIPARRTDAVRRADEIEREINAALSPMQVETAALLGPVLILHHLEPPAAFGPGSYLVQVLESLGARDAITTGGPWQELDLETIVRLDPWAIVLTKPGANPKTDPRTWLGSLNNLNLMAVNQNRIAALTHPEALLPGSCIAEVADELRYILTNFAENAATSDGQDQ